MAKSSLHLLTTELPSATMRKYTAFPMVSALCLLGCVQPSAPVAQGLRTPPVTSTVDSQPGLTTYVSGSGVDVNATPLGGTLLAGGGTDSEEAMRWLLAQGGTPRGKASGARFGDVVVLRASGADGYHRMLMGLGASSVRSFVITSAAAANSDVVRRAIEGAEVIFIAGGDQSRYVSLWSGSLLQAAVNARVAAGYPIGGTSAGLAVLSPYVYAALNVSSTSATVLANPHDTSVTISDTLFNVPVLQNLITDSHFTVRDRMGRLVTFLARLQQDGRAAAPRGIGIDEKSAVAVTKEGSATVLGGGNGAYFLRVTNSATRVCTPQRSLTFFPVETVRVAIGQQFDLPSWSAVSLQPYTLTATAGVLSSSTGSIY